MYFMPPVKYLILIFCIVFFYISIIASASMLDDYVEQGLKSNIELQNKIENYNKKLWALSEAKGLFYPNLSFNARYSLAEGGRTIDIPLGDALNPLYSGLHQMSRVLYNDGVINGVYPPTSFENETFNFYRPREHETKLRLVQPIFNTDIYFNKKIKKELSTGAKIEIERYKNELEAEIRKAYYDYLSTLEGLDVLNRTKDLVNENIRVNKKLFNNNKVTKDAVYRAKAEKSKLEQQIAETIKLSKTAKAYFNFILNRGLNDSIIADTSFIKPFPLVSVDSASENAIKNRKEIERLNSYSKAREYYLKLQKSQRLPEFMIAVDYGFQGEKYLFTKQYDFAIASFVLKWYLFEGFQKNARIQQAKIDKKIIELKKEKTKQQIKLETIKTYHSLEASFKSISHAKNELKANSETYKIIYKKYLQGKVGMLELINARNNMTKSENNLIIKKYDYLKKMAEFKRVTSL